MVASEVEVGLLVWNAPVSPPVDDFLGAFLMALGKAPAVDALAFTPSRNPYKGLHAFSELDAQDFYGRDALIQELVHAVKQHRLVAVIGHGFRH